MNISYSPAPFVNVIPLTLNTGKNLVLRLSILIPVLNKLKNLEDTLVSILENRPANCQFVVVLNEPYADPYQLRDEVCFVEASRDADLIESINFGLASCHAPIIHILSCGLEVSPGWTDPVLPLFTDPAIAAVAPLVLQRRDRNKVISAGVGYRASGAARRVGFGKSPEQASLEKEHFFGADILAAFFRRSAWDAVNGLNPALKGYLAGVDLALALHFAGFRCTSEPNCRIYAELDDAAGADRLGGGRAAERLFWTWASRMGWLQALSGHALLMVEECLESVVRPAALINLCGRAWEALLFPMHKPTERKVISPSSTFAHPIAPPHFAAKQRRRSAAYADKQ
ncbi:MAG: glycosyltransferase [Thermoguttaceae bacterium]